MRNSLIAGLLVSGGLLIGGDIGVYHSSFVQPKVRQQEGQNIGFPVQSTPELNVFGDSNVQMRPGSEEFQRRLDRLNNTSARYRELRGQIEGDIQRSQIRLDKLNQSPLSSPLFEFAVCVPMTLYENQKVNAFNSVMHGFNEYKFSTGETQDAKD